MAYCVLYINQFNLQFYFLFTVYAMADDDILFDEVYELYDVIWRYWAFILISCIVRIIQPFCLTQGAVQYSQALRTQAD